MDLNLNDKLEKRAKQFAYNVLPANATHAEKKELKEHFVDFAIHVKDLLCDGKNETSEPPTKALPLHGVVFSEAELCKYESDNTTAMNCKHCGMAKFMHD